MSVVLRCKLATHNEKIQNCHRSVCSKFCQLCFCQILFELVYSRESYRKNNKSSATAELSRDADDVDFSVDDVRKT